MTMSMTDQTTNAADYLPQDLQTLIPLIKRILETDSHEDQIKLISESPEFRHVPPSQAGNILTILSLLVPYSFLAKHIERLSTSS